jgi:hypothetical protein
MAGSLAPEGIDIAEDELAGIAVDAGAVLPGDMPGAVCSASFGPPVGAGLLGAMLELGALVLDIVPTPEVEGAMLPGESFGLVVAAALGAPVGAGEDEAVCAIAAPVQTMIAAEASQRERMLVSC